MKEWFRDRNFREESKDLIDSCNEIVEQYQSQGLRKAERGSRKNRTRRR